MIAVDQGEARPDPHERDARRFMLLREVRAVSSEFDDGTQ
jgi:hypothetical protein